MEAAALFAVGEALNVDVASAVVVSDEVRPEGVRMDYMQAITPLLALARNAFWTMVERV